MSFYNFWRNNEPQNFKNKFSCLEVYFFPWNQHFTKSNKEGNNIDASTKFTSSIGKTCANTQQILLKFHVLYGVRDKIYWKKKKNCWKPLSSPKYREQLVVLFGDHMKVLTEIYPNCDDMGDIMITYGTEITGFQKDTCIACDYISM